MRSTRGRRAALIAAAVIVGSSWASFAHAHSGGMPGGGCSGCHNAGDYAISVSTQPAMIVPGNTVTVTVQVSSPTGAVAGMFVDANAGELDTIGGQGLAEVAAGLTHSSPKSLQSGSVAFSFQWTAPNEPGAVRFGVWTLVGNGNGSSSGDMANEGQFDFVYGCPAQQYFRDFDGDGYGRATAPLVHCVAASPTGYVIPGDDCDDNDAQVFPGATEYCNLRDDDCDGAIDNDALPVDLYPDGDGDGYYSLAELQSGDMMVGCVPTPGYAAFGGDCAPELPEINPGAEEQCNLYDDNCDGRVDEGVRPQCGEGWCRREAPTCDPASCSPGEPREEVCNLFDEDCDGVPDNDVTCPDAEVCIAGECRSDDAATTTGQGDDGDDSASGTAGSDDATTGPGASAEGKGCTIGGHRSSFIFAIAIVLVCTRRRGAAQHWPQTAQALEQQSPSPTHAPSHQHPSGDEPPQ